MGRAGAAAAARSGGVIPVRVASTPQQQAVWDTQAAAQATDDAWSRELARLFNGTAGDVRYAARGKGEPGSKLRELYDARMQAQRVWLAAIDEWRKG